MFILKVGCEMVVRVGLKIDENFILLNFIMEILCGIFNFFEEIVFIVLNVILLFVVNMVVGG